MGIDYKASVFVGLPRADIYTADKQELLEDEQLEVCPPCYGGGGEDYAICGFELARSETYGAREFTYDSERCEKLKAQFKELTGLDAKVWLSPYGY